jgi:ubiquinone/menaquinone biosynthesis C-methylase UbiE
MAVEEGLTPCRACEPETTIHLPADRHVRRVQGSPVAAPEGEPRQQGRGPVVTDLQAVKERSRVVWAAGDYTTVGCRIQYLAELLCEAIPVRAGDRVLDVATGTGNAALAAARRFADVTAIDFVPDLLARGRRRAEAEGLEVDFREGDAEALDFADESFDVVLSTCGVMFAPDQERAASELLRVCRPGGAVGMVNWTPEGLVGAIFRAMGALVPPPPGGKPAVRWGSEEGLRELFGDKVTITAPVRSFWFRMPSLEDWANFYADNYGPTVKTVEALGSGGREAVVAAMIDAAKPFNRAIDGTAELQLDYLEVVIRKPA